jgi:hemoglobin
MRDDISLQAAETRGPASASPPRSDRRNPHSKQALDTEAIALESRSPSLFERLGGSAGINQLVEHIVVLHMDNPAIRARFRPYLGTPDKLAIIKKHLCAFLEAGSGGAAQYCGRSMLDAHRGMNISEAEYMAALDDILQAMRQNVIDEQTQKDVLAIAYSLKGDIIRV